MSFHCYATTRSVGMRKQETSFCALISICSMSSYTRDSKNGRLSTAVHRRHEWGCFSAFLCAFINHFFSAVSPRSHSVCTGCNFHFHFPLCNSAEYDYFKYHPMEEVGDNIPVMSLAHRWHENTWRLKSVVGLSWVDGAVFFRSRTGWRRFRRTTLTSWPSWIMERPMKWKPLAYLR